MNLVRHCLLGSVVFVLPLSVSAAEWALESDVDVRTEYNDNIFLTDLPHDDVYALKITPSIDAIVREAEWQLGLNARITNNNYSDHTLDSNDEFYTLTGSYSGERNIFSLSANYFFDSNLSSVSSDFEVFGRRVNREIKRVTPTYTRLLTERSTLVLSYSFSETDYLNNALVSRFVPFELQTLSGSYIYDLTEKDRLTLSLRATDYKSQNRRTEYLLLSSRIGIEHEFSKTLSMDFLVGNTRQDVTRRSTQLVITSTGPGLVTVESESSNRGLVLDAGMTKNFETSEVEGRVSRSDNADSLGNLNQVDSFSVSYKHTLSKLLSYKSFVSYEDIEVLSSSSVVNSRVDRELLTFDTVVSYRLTPDWTTSFSYRYSSRRLKRSAGNNTAPHSNRIYVAITYNFPSLTTF